MDPMSAAVNGALLTTVIVAGPFLAVVMSVGMIVSLFQALTQINEMTLSFVPKFLGTAWYWRCSGRGCFVSSSAFSCRFGAASAACCHDHSGRAGSGRTATRPRGAGISRRSRDRSRSS